jgi:hypothetical protein
MTFRGIPFAAIQPESRKKNDIFCRSDLVPANRICGGFSPSREFPLPCLPFVPLKSLHCFPMSLPVQPNLKLINAADYREAYANSVQMRVNVWDFFMVFGTLQQQTETQVEIRNFQGIYLSPQQAKALLGLLQQNIAGYESAFGEIKLDPRLTPTGPVH